MVLVAPLIVIAVALLALLLYYGAEKMGDVIIHFTPNISLPGLGSLKDAVRLTVNTGVTGLQKILHPVVKPIVSFIEGTALWTVHVVGGLVDVAPAAAGAIHRVLTVVIPHKLDQLRDWAARLVHAAAARLWDGIHHVRNLAYSWVIDARHYAAHLAAAALATAIDRVHDLRAWTTGELGDVRDWTRGRLAALAAATAHDLAGLRSWTAQHVLRLDHEIAAAVDKVEADIATATATAIHYVDIDMIRPLEAAWEGVEGDVAGVLGSLAGDFPDIGALLRTLDLSKLIDLVGVSGLSVVMSRVLARYLRECGVPTCRNTAGWAKAMMDVLDGIGDAALLAFFIEMITEPQTAAHTVNDLLGGLARPFIGEIKSLIGV